MTREDFATDAPAPGLFDLTPGQVPADEPDLFGEMSADWRTP